MKLKKRFKYILLLTLSTMYLTGLITWVMSHWFLIDSGFGNEPSPFRLFWLQMHSVIGLWFMVLFGYMFHAHVRPSWKKRKRIKTGAALTLVLIILCATVPGLFYITNETFKVSVAWTHTYIGLCTVFIFLLHYFSKRK